MLLRVLNALSYVSLLSLMCPLCTPAIGVSVLYRLTPPLVCQVKLMTGVGIHLLVPATNNQQQATSNRQPTISNQQHRGHTQRAESCAVVHGVCAIVLLCAVMLCAAMQCAMVLYAVCVNEQMRACGRSALSKCALG